jgi:hypothetical protein
MICHDSDRIVASSELLSARHLPGPKPSFDLRHLSVLFPF